MRSKKIETDIVNMINLQKATAIMSIILCICLFGPGVLRTACGQGTAVETLGTMELSQEVDNAASRSTPARGAINVKSPAKDANNATQPPQRSPADMQGRPNPAETPVQPEPARNPAGIETQAAIPETKADANDFNSFKQELDRIDMEARGEDSQWLGKQEKKAELAKAMDDVVVAELKFLRKVAASTNDANTVEAIDLVLKKRQDRLNKLTAKLANEVKEERRQMAGERQQRRTPRTGGVQQQDQTQTARPNRQLNRVVGGGGD